MTTATKPAATAGDRRLSEQEIATLRALDFDWAMLLRSVWADPKHDSPELQTDIRQHFADRIDRLKADRSDNSPAGWIVLGAAGSGKTHWLSVCRQQAVARQMGFVLVDMTDVRDFWETVLQGYLDSLQQVYVDAKFQQQILLERFLATLPLRQPAEATLKKLREFPPESLAKNISAVVHEIQRKYPQDSPKHQDVIRALVATNSHDPDLSAAGLSWLQGNPVDEKARIQLGFAKGQEQPRKIVQALSWLMSLCGPTVLAFDQLDPIVSCLNLASYAGSAEATSQVMAARAIIENISAGFGALRDVTRKTFTVVACLEATWSALADTLRSNLDRYEAPLALPMIQSQQTAESILWPRLRAAYAETGFAPPYSTWPFPTEVLAKIQGTTPRNLLKRCERYRQACLATGREVEWSEPEEQSDGNRNSRSSDLERQLDAKFAEYRQSADPEQLLEQAMEDDRLAPLLLSACKCLVKEVSLPDHLDAIVDEFPGGMTTRPLHARVRLIDRSANDREEHFCLRAIERTNPVAFQHRLKGAITGSGIAQNIHFRRALLLRSRQMPGGKITEQLVAEFRARGGLWHRPSEDEVRTLFALHKLWQAGLAGLDDWLKSRRPASNLPLLQLLAPRLCGSEPEANSAGETALPASSGSSSQPDGKQPVRVPPPASNTDRPIGAKAQPGQVPPTIEAAQTRSALPKPARPTDGQSSTEVKAKAESPAPTKTRTDQDGNLKVGYRQLGNAENPVFMPLQLLEKHTVVLAGAGSGKTVLLKRVIEEAAIQGIPSIVIDCANDMAALGDRWPTPPAEWRPGDAEKAHAYHASSEVVVWTPLLPNGNPLVFEPIPDLNAVADDPAELQTAVDMVRETLIPIVAPGRTTTSQGKSGILTTSLKYLAKHSPESSLSALIQILSDLPEEAGTGIQKQERLARDMADALRSKMADSPLLGGSGKGLNPAVLFGDDRPGRERTRVSVISFVGMASQEGQQHFLNQLAMTLFAWVKRNPRPNGRSLRGLLVIDEAKDFIPSTRGTPCKESLQRLAAQARKYRLGLVFATQNPKEIANTIIGNCSTHFYGKNSSPAGQEVIREQLRQRGGDGSDIASLAKGNFYFFNADAGHAKPTKIRTPLCLSHHVTLEPQEVTERAARSRTSL